MDLALCSSCRRHVRDDETRCPFCASRIPIRTAAVVATAFGLVSCQAMYGGPPIEDRPATPPTTAAKTAKPAPSATAKPPPAPDDDLRGADIYGAPPPPDDDVEAEPEGDDKD